MKWPCKKCIVRARCGQECPDYEKFSDYIKNVLSPIMMLFSCIFAGSIMFYFAILNDYYKGTWLFVACSRGTWIAIQDEEDSFILTFISPAFLPGYIGMKLLAWKYKRT